MFRTSFMEDFEIPPPTPEPQERRVRFFAISLGPLGQEHRVGALSASSWRAFWPVLWWWLNSDTSGVGQSVGSGGDETVVTIRCGFNGEQRWVAVVRQAHGGAGFIEISERVRRAWCPAASIPKQTPTQHLGTHFMWLVDCQLRDDMVYFLVLDGPDHWRPDPEVARWREARRRREERRRR